MAEIGSWAEANLLYTSVIPESASVSLESTCGFIKDELISYESRRPTSRPFRKLSLLETPSDTCCAAASGSCVSSAGGIPVAPDAPPGIVPGSAPGSADEPWDDIFHANGKTGVDVELQIYADWIGPGLWM
jgi:hypothetical protein